MEWILSIGGRLDVVVLNKRLESLGFVEDNNLLNYAMRTKHLIQDVHCDWVNSIVDCHEQDTVGSTSISILFEK